MSESLNTKKLSWKTFLRAALPYAVMIAVVIILRTFVIGSFNIPSPSMETTLMVGDVTVVNYLDKDPRQGDIVVFTDELGWLEKPGQTEADGEHLIKRVAAVGGDTIESVNGTIIVNGKPWDTVHARGVNADFPAQVVPAGHYFMLGDNREFSADSRYHIESGSQYVAADSIVGRAFFAITFNPLNLRPLDSQ